MATQRGCKAVGNICKQFNLLRLSAAKAPSVPTLRPKNSNIASKITLSPASSLQNRVTSLALYPTSIVSEKEYVLPNVEKNLDVVIVDQGALNSRVYDCPTILNTVQDIIAPHVNKKINIITPTTVTNDNGGKYAKNIMKIRRRKMNRHLLKKFRKRNLFKLRAQTLMRKKKREKIFQAHLNTIAKWAEDFNAEDFVQSELRKARRGGFMVDVYATRDHVQK